jgi:hypothetical protein
MGNWNIDGWISAFRPQTGYRWCGTLNAQAAFASLAVGGLPLLSEGLTKMSDSEQQSGDMRNEYDFSGAEQGKHFRAYRGGHSVQVTQADGTIEERHITLAEGAVMIDPELKTRFPDSDAVNKALRSIATAE